ncbi:MAG TPA: hypothetical protein VLB84_10130 [Bacteroidia bacterium]|nr:hypothetical protein [Bacteroidia bacterium]
MKNNIGLKRQVSNKSTSKGDYNNTFWTKQIQENGDFFCNGSFYPNMFAAFTTSDFGISIDAEKRS